MKKKTILWTIGIGIILIASAVLGYRMLGEEQAATVPSLATAEVRRGDLEVSVSGTGSIQPSDQIEVKSGKDGTIEEVRVEEGSKVSKGDILITLEREEETDASRQIRSKEIQIEQLALQLTELQDQFKTAADESERDSARISITKQQLDIEIAKEELAELLEDVTDDDEDIVIRADIDGMVTSLDAAAGDQIKAGAVLGAIVNYDILHMVASIDELDITKVTEGLEADLYVEALPDENIKGHVVEIAREGVTQNGVATYDVTLEVLDNSLLKPGMSAEAAIQVEKKEHTLLLPVDAVTSMGGRYFATVIREGSEERNQSDGIMDRTDRPDSGRNDVEAVDADRQEGATLLAGAAYQGVGQRIPIEVGIANEDYIEVLSGLSEGDKVILPNSPASGQSAFQGGAMPGGSFNGGGGIGVRGGGALGGVRP